MHPAANRLRLEEELAEALRGRRASSVFGAFPVSETETMATGISEVDALTGGLPRGHITEVTGTTSSGRTSLLLSVLAEVSGKEEVAALVDPGDAFDPASAAAFGVELDRLLWIRTRKPRTRKPRTQKPRAGKAARGMDSVLRITDLLLQGGGFGLIGVDLSPIPAREIRRVPLSVWFRLRRVAEHTPTLLLFLTEEPTLKTAATLTLRMDLADIRWSGHFLSEVRPGARVLRSRQNPSASGRTRRFPLRPTALIEAGWTHFSGVAIP